MSEIEGTPNCEDPVSAQKALQGFDTGTSRLLGVNFKDGQKSNNRKLR